MKNNLEIVYRPLADLKPNPKNPREAVDGAVQNLAESIKNNPKYFEARPILLSDRTGELVILGGERRSEAAELLGMTEVPTILFHGLTEEQEDEIMVRDNTHAGRWNNTKLLELQKLWGGAKLMQWDAPKLPDIDISGLFKPGDDNVHQSKQSQQITIILPNDADIEDVRGKILAALDGIEFKIK